jgi:hypothetical protein
MQKHGKRYMQIKHRPSIDNLMAAIIFSLVDREERHKPLIVGRLVGMRGCLRMPAFCNLKR